MKNRLSPERIIVGSFVAAILVGTFFLMLPVSTVDGKGLSLVDAFFTATSATCVTGLIVVDTGSYLSRFGQLVVLLLIQCGGLGIMTLSTFFIVVLGKRVSLRGKLILQDALNFYDMESLFDLLKHIILFTFVIEFFGFLLLFFDFRLSWHYPWGKAFYHAFFHSISAFCNAGFSLYSDSLSRFVGDYIVNFTVMGLIILGGLGFPVLYDLYRRVFRKDGTESKHFLSYHTKVVVTVTGILIVVGTLMIFLFECSNTLKVLDFKEKILASLFQSVTPRTAGFNTIDIGAMREVSWLFIMVLMFIGASPGGTGGGIKTTTFVSVLMSVISIVRNREDVVLFKKRIPERVIKKSIAIFSLSLFIVVLGTTFICYFENIPLSKVMFEVFSAFGTVGLSTGITSSLHWFSKVMISLIMLTGRVGPLTAVVAMAEAGLAPPIRYPEGEILVG